MRLGRLIGSIVAALCVLLSGAAANAFAATTLRGVGSTLVWPLLSEWTGAFETATGNSVQFGDEGSSQGIIETSENLIDFGASDTPLTSAQQQSCTATAPGTCLMIPWALTAIGVGYNIPGIGSGLRLDGTTLANIFIGKITNWDDSAIKKLNPALKLPNREIVAIAQTDLDGTATFSSYLSDVSSAWASCCGATDLFSTGIKTANNPSAASKIKSTPGAIGYVSGSYLLADGVSTAEIENAAGAFEYPNPNAVAAAAAVSTVGASGINIVDPPSSQRIAYPIATFDYAIVPRHPAKNVAVLKQWLDFCVTTGRTFGFTIDFSPIPAAVEAAAKADIAEISQKS